MSVSPVLGVAGSPDSLGSLDSLGSPGSPGRDWTPAAVGERLSPRRAYREVREHGAVLVDLRPDHVRRRAGQVHPVLAPLVIAPDDLESRLDPHSDERLAEVTADLRVILLCADGVLSARAVHDVQGFGLRRATDVVGGFTAWRGLRLPVVAPFPGVGAVPRMAPAR